MNISKIFTSNVALPKVNNAFKVNPFMTQDLQKDTFERSSEVSFEGKKGKPKTNKPNNKPNTQAPNRPKQNWGEASKVFEELSTIKVNNKPKMSPKDIKKIATIVQETPEKWDSVKVLANNPSIKGKQVTKLAKEPLDRLKGLVELSTIKKDKNESRFSGEDLLKFKDVGLNKFSQIKEMAPTKLYTDAMVAIIDEDIINLPKLVDKAKNLEKEAGDELQGGIAFKRNIYDNSDFEMTADLKDYGSKTYLLDKKLDVLAKEKVELYFTDKKDYQIVKTNDYRNNTTSKVRMEITPEGMPITTHEIRIVKDKNGEKVRTEKMEPSDIKGVYNVKYEYPNGKVEKVSEGIVDKKSGITTVKKNLTSLNGTKTEFFYSDDKEGNRIVDYKITNKDGKVLYDEARTFEVLSENKFKSTSKNTAHEITVNPDNMKIKDLETENEVTIPFAKTIQGNKDVIKKLLKKVPGEELIKMQENVKVVKGANSLEDCYLAPAEKEISTVDDLYAFLHELGHSKDFKNLKPTDEKEIGIYSNDEKIQEIYMKEKEAFNEAFPNAQREHINYFIDQTEHYAGEWGGLGEVVAEANALVQTYNDELDIAPRVQYLQQYFPETVAYLGNKFNEKVEDTKVKTRNVPHKKFDMVALNEIKQAKKA